MNKAMKDLIIEDNMSWRPELTNEEAAVWLIQNMSEKIHRLADKVSNIRNHFYWNSETFYKDFEEINAAMNEFSESSKRGYEAVHWIRKKKGFDT